MPTIVWTAYLCYRVGLRGFELTKLEMMIRQKIRYFEEDVLHLVITDEPEASSLELSPLITVELNAQHEVIGVEILKASSFLRDAVFESIQARTFGRRPSLTGRFLILHRA